MFSGVEEYPDVETLEKFNDWCIVAGWHRYFDSKIYLMTRMDADQIMKLVNLIEVTH